MLRDYEKRGRPCPRTLLHPENQDAWQVLRMSLSPDSAGMLSAFGSGLAAHRSLDELRMLYARVDAVRCDPDFVEVLEEYREKERAEKQTERDADSAWIAEQ